MRFFNLTKKSFLTIHFIGRHWKGEGRALGHPCTLCSFLRQGVSWPSDKGGGGHPDSEIRGGPVSKIFFAAPRASAWSKNKGTGPPGPSPRFATVRYTSPLLGPNTPSASDANVLKNITSSFFPYTLKQLVIKTTLLQQDKFHFILVQRSTKQRCCNIIQCCCAFVNSTIYLGTKWRSKTKTQKCAHTSLILS